MDELVIASLTGFEELPVPGALVDLDGTIVAINAEGARLIGRDRALLVGRKTWDLAPGLELGWRELVAARHSTGDLAIVTDRGVTVIEYAYATRHHAGRDIIVVFAMDISRHKHAEQRAQEAIERERRMAASQRLESLGLVAGGMAHELNNLLVSVVAEASVLREEATTDATRDAVGRIETAAKRMTHLTRQLLAYTGRGRFVTSLVDPESLLDDKRERLVRRLPIDARLDVVPGAGAVAVEADRGLLRQVIRDLVENAAEALRDGRGHIRVTSRTAEVDGKPFWELEVRDDGVGMSTATQARIFDPFFTTKPDRRGLGLSAVLGIVRRLGGDIAVSSEEGIGSKFRVRLPIVPGIAAPRRRSTSEQPVMLAIAGLRVLLADDEPTVRATVGRLLERRGAIPVVASDGAEAEALLRTETFDLVLLDVLMPKKTGYELIPLARQLQPHAPVILMSGYTEQARGVEPPDQFVEKPFTAEVLDTAIRAAMSRTGDPENRE
ncbi:MAG: ATP-binding protein [Acidobacteriota bacterium]